MSEIYNDCFPSVRIFRKAYKNKSWFSADLRTMLYEKNRLYKLWLNSADDKDKLLYVSYKKKYTKTCRETKINYYKNILNVKTSSNKKIWENFNVLLANNAKSSNPNGVENLLYNNVLYDNKLDVANIFNQYFVDVGGNLAKALPPASINFRSYLEPSNQNSMYVEPILDDEVYKLINSMSGGKAAGDDGFNLELLKNIAATLAQPLTYIYNLSYFQVQSQKPSKWLKLYRYLKKKMKNFQVTIDPFLYLVYLIK